MRKRSHYRPRPVIKPLGIKDDVVLELHTRISALALDTDWIEMQHLRDIGAHALLCEQEPSACSVMDTVYQCGAVQPLLSGVPA